jgi:hypothetical protein
MTDDLCPICLNNLDNGRTIKTLNCRHRFHATCMNDWIENMEENNLPRKCPMCRGDMTESNLTRTETLNNAVYNLAHIFFHDEVIQYARRYQRLATLIGFYMLYNWGNIVSHRINFNIYYYTAHLMCKIIKGRSCNDNDTEFWLIFMVILIINIPIIIQNNNTLTLQGRPTSPKKTTLSLKKTTRFFNKKTTMSIKKDQPPSNRSLNLFIDKALKPIFKDISSKKVKVKPGFIDKKMLNKLIDERNRVFFANFIMHVRLLTIGITKDEKTFKKYVRSNLKKLHKKLKQDPKSQLNSSIQREIRKLLEK